VTINKLTKQNKLRIVGERDVKKFYPIRWYEPFFLSYGVIKEIKLQILQSQTLRILIILDMFLFQQNFV